MGRKLGDLNAPSHPTGRPFQSDFISGTGRVMGQKRNEFLPEEEGQDLHHGSNIHTDNVGPKGTGVPNVGSLPSTPSQPGHGDHTPH